MSVAGDVIKVIACKLCGKLQRLLAMPIDAAGRPAMQFRITCTRCHNAETYGVHDLITMKQPGAKAG